MINCGFEIVFGAVLTSVLSHLSFVIFTSRAESPERYYNHEGGRPAGRALLHVVRFLKKYLIHDHEILHTLRLPWEDVLRIFW
jgi:hypothetical protein